MSTEIISYAKAGVVNEHSGRDWFDRDTCPYCRAALTQQGSFHTPEANLLQVGEREGITYVLAGPRVYEIEKSWVFKDGDGFCMNCGCRTARIDRSRPPIQLERYYDDFYYPLDASPGRNCFFRVATCGRCGWWYAVENADMCNDGFAAAYTGVLEAFDLGSAIIPLQVLEVELPKNLHRINGIHPKRMEDLVSHILAGVFDCEVHQLGYTRDGGVDLVLLHSDNPVAVQVKRREDHRRTEGVSGIREFLGAALLGDFRHLIYATNAERFSAAATQAAEQAVEKGLVERYELLSLDALQSLFPRPDSIELWRQAIVAVMEGKYKMPSVPDPYAVVNLRPVG